MKKQRTAVQNILCIFFAVILCFSVFAFLNFAPVRADSIEYTDVLEDLQKDETFDAAKYVANDNDNSLQVIQIAESAAGELFIYVYQPSARARDLRASSIYISKYDKANHEPEYIEYDLSFCNLNGVFYKYVVNDFTISNEATRFYDILRIHRPWDNNLDGEPGGDNTGDYQVYSVAKMFVATTFEGQTIYTCLKQDVMELTFKYVGFVEYFSGSFIEQFYTDSHYIAFDTDRPIDRILDIEVSFVTQSVQTYPNGEFVPLGDPVEHNNVKIERGQIGSNPVYGLFAHKVEWPLISSVQEFKADNDLTNVTEENLQGAQWVVRFYQNTHVGQVHNVLMSAFEKVTDVTVLRIQYEYNDQVFNLGVIDNKQSGGLLPDNEQPPWWYWIIVAISVLGSVILVLALVPQILSSIFGLTDVEWSVGGVIKLILKLLLLAVMIVILIAAIRSIIQGTIITDELFGLFGLDSPIDFY